MRYDPDRDGDDDTGAVDELPAPHRMYPTAQPRFAPPMVPLTEDFSAHYAAGGYPDIEDAGLRYAAGQRAAAAEQENRAALSKGRTDGAVMRPRHQGVSRVGIATTIPEAQQ